MIRRMSRYSCFFANFEIIAVLTHKDTRRRFLTKNYQGPKRHDRDSGSPLKLYFQKSADDKIKNKNKTFA